MKLRTRDWIIILFLLVLSVLPDPTDLIDFGLPIFEPLMAFVYYYWRRKK